MTTTRTIPSDRRRRRTASTLVLGGLAVVAAACGSTESTAPASTTPPTSATTTSAPSTTATTATTATTTPATTVDPTTSTTASAPARPTGDRDEHVNVGGTDVHLRCTGSGSSTVVLVAGFGDGADGWTAVEPALAQRARVCSYDRPGTGDSGPADATQTFSSQADGLDLLLRTAGEPGPYVVVGHSFGGGAAVRFATEHADDTAGLVLVDASPAGWATSLCQIADDGTGAAQFIRGMCDSWSDPTGNPEHLDVFAAFAELDAVTSLGDLPIAVVTAEHRELPADASATERTRLDDAWATGQQRLADLSSTSRLITVATGHYVQVEQPAVVVDEITRLLP